jgi:hypothetical protein
MQHGFHVRASFVLRHPFLPPTLLIASRKNLGVNKVLTLNLSPKLFPFTRTLFTAPLVHAHAHIRAHTHTHTHTHTKQARSLIPFCGLPFLGIPDLSSYFLATGTCDGLELKPQLVFMSPSASVASFQSVCLGAEGS